MPLVVPLLRVLPAEDYVTALEVAFTGVVKPWYWRLLGVRPRAFTVAHLITVQEEHAGNLSLLAHEYGHATDTADHPSPLDVLGWVDVMSPIPTRWLDRHGLKPLTEAWLRGE